MVGGPTSKLGFHVLEKNLKNFSACLAQCEYQCSTYNYTNKQMNTTTGLCVCARALVDTYPPEVDLKSTTLTFFRQKREITERETEEQQNFCQRARRRERERASVFMVKYCLTKPHYFPTKSEEKREKPRPSPFCSHYFFLGSAYPGSHGSS